ncbi:MAG TPA: molybdenum cofactor biosynthesis protein MoaE [Rhizomicrobium sp.]|jgi:molybdopterin synthase catalytic subunit
MRTVRVQTADFDIEAECRALAGGRPAIGAVVAFTGYVRGGNGLTALTIEHYPGMTEREIGRHAAEAEDRWPLDALTIIHRIGRLGGGDRIVLVAAASARREPAFQAAEFLMDYLKTRAPFWKREERGTSMEWVEAKESDATAALKWHRS